MVAAKSLPPGSHLVTVFADRMERYFSTELFEPFRAESTVAPNGRRS
jgi:hypothetical protein